MKTIAKVLCVLFVPAAVLTCGRANFVAYYDMKLTDVEKPSSVSGMLDSVRVADEQEEAYEDGIVRMFWVPTVTGIALKLVNKTDEPIDVLWGEAEYLDEEGAGHAVVHTMQAEGGTGAPTSIPARGAFETVLGPADKAVSTGGAVTINPIFSTYSGSIEGQLRRSARGHIGKSIRIVLPLRVRNQALTYVNTFEVVDAGVVRKLDE